MAAGGGGTGMLTKQVGQGAQADAGGLGPFVPEAVPPTSPLPPPEQEYKSNNTPALNNLAEVLRISIFSSFLKLQMVSFFIILDYKRLIGRKYINILQNATYLKYFF
jgi:hypothetical protein